MGHADHIPILALFVAAIDALIWSETGRLQDSSPEEELVLAFFDFLQQVPVLLLIRILYHLIVA